jgi:hypothetical protein
MFLPRFASVCCKSPSIVEGKLTCKKIPRRLAGFLALTQSILRLSPSGERSEMRVVNYIMPHMPPPPGIGSSFFGAPATISSSLRIIGWNQIVDSRILKAQQ